MLLKKAICFTMAMAMISASAYARPSVDYISTSQISGGEAKTISSTPSNYGKIVTSYMYVNDKDTFTVVDAGKDAINVDTYNSKTYELKNSKKINMELPLFGGFYCGEKYNFIVFGQSNPNESDRIVTFKTVKYSKDWKKLGSADYKGNNTLQPFEAGSLRMVEYNGYLYIRTAHKMYKSSDGLNHQSNLTFSVDIENMNIADEYSEIMNANYGYVSHSFDQFITIDNDKLIALDLGDAYPRSVVLIKYNDSLTDGKFTASNGYCSVIDMLKIPGKTGDNYTGVTIGGLEASKNNYIVAISSIDQKNKSTTRDVVLLITGKSDSSPVKQIRITDYTKNQNGLSASKPYLVKLPDGNYELLWEEFSEGNSHRVFHVKIDENGKMLTNITEFSNAKLSSDCQPICIDNQIVWYINDGTERIFYKLDI